MITKTGKNGKHDNDQENGQRLGNGNDYYRKLTYVLFGTSTPGGAVNIM